MDATRVVYPCQYVIDRQQPCKMKCDHHECGCDINKCRGETVSVESGFDGRPVGGGAPTVSFPQGLAFQDSPFFFPPINTEGRLLIKRRARKTGVCNNGCW